MINYIKAIKLVWQAQKLASQYLQDAVKLNDKIVGYHIGNGAAFYENQIYVKYDLPYRMYKDVKLLDRDKPFPCFEIRLNPGFCVYSPGNEEENNINLRPSVTAAEWIMGIRKFDEVCNKPIGSPSLMTLAQKKGFWGEVIDLKAEKYFDYWCINSHGPGYLWTGNRLSSIGYFNLWVRNAKHMIDFAEEISKPVIVTECGVGQYHFFSPGDLYFLYHLHKLIFGSRLLGLLFYDDDLVRRCNSHLLFS